jgi:hypothetical protein
MSRLLLLGCAGLALITASAQARVTRIEISRQEPFAAGQTFGSVGAYEKVVGRFHGELDPKSPLNAAIVDLDKAPRNAHGMVGYSADFYILKPVDITKGNGTLFYELANRGNKGILPRCFRSRPFHSLPVVRGLLGQRFAGQNRDSQHPGAPIPLFSRSRSGFPGISGGSSRLAR